MRSLNIALAASVPRSPRHAVVSHFGEAAKKSGVSGRFRCSGRLWQANLNPVLLKARIASLGSGSAAGVAHHNAMDRRIAHGPFSGRSITFGPDFTVNFKSDVDFSAYLAGVIRLGGAGGRRRALGCGRLLARHRLRRIDGYYVVARWKCLVFSDGNLVPPVRSDGADPGRTRADRVERDRAAA